MFRRCWALFVGVLVLTRFESLHAAFSEPQELHRLVQSGALPPLGQRLPIAPLVVSPLEKPGNYGGVWRMVLVGYDQGPLLSRCLAYENLVRWDPNWSRVIPNVASSWSVSSNATDYTFRLRAGMRWSDGHPFTSKDVVAWVEDVAGNAELTPVPPGWLMVGGRLAECGAPDALTVVFKFDQPNALFLEQLAGMRANELTRYPAHFFRPMHPRHNPQGAAALAARTGLPWPEAFRTIYSPWTWRNPAAPTLDAWVITNAYVKGASSVTAVRNPYYWKVDTLGRQLPYLDKLSLEVVPNSQEALKRALAGEIDYQRDSIASVGEARRLHQLEQTNGPFRTVRIIPSLPNPLALSLNMTHRDPALRAALGNHSVRVALSEAINRSNIIEKVFGGGSRPWQIAPRPESALHNRRLGKQHTEFAPAEASRLLDEAGFSRDPATGLRRLRDGNDFRIKILVPAPGSPDWPMILDLVRADWLAIGVAMSWEITPREEYYRLVAGNLHDAAVWWSGGGYAATLEPEYYVPVSFERLGAIRVPYAVPWARWFVDPKASAAERPPDKIIRQMDLFRQVTTESNRQTRNQLMSQVLEMAADEFYVLGICLEPETYGVRTPGFRNVPASHFDSWLYPDPGPLNPCQFFQE